MLLTTAVQLVRDDGVTTSLARYRRDSLDAEWTVLSNASGGYILALLLSACSSFQSDTSHGDPLSMSTHFFAAARVSRPVVVEVRLLRRSRSLSHLQAVLFQDDKELVSSTVIFCDFSSTPGPTLPVNSPFYPLNALLTERQPTPPLADSPLTLPSKFNFSRRLGWHVVPEISAARRGGLQWGAWAKYKDEEPDQVGLAHLAFLSDLMLHGPDVLLQHEENGAPAPPQWYPTLAHTVQFFQRLPPPSARSPFFGLKSTTSSLDNGRHDNALEIWIVEEGTDVDASGDKGRSRCIARSWQVALTGGPKAKKTSAKL